MSEEERLRKENELRQAWYEMRKKKAEAATTSKPQANESPLNLKTKPSPKSQRNTRTYKCKRINILEDRILHNAPHTYVLPNVYIQNNYYEPISPPENTYIITAVDSNPTTDTNTEASTTVQDETVQNGEHVEEFHVFTHDQYLEYLTFKKHFESAQNETVQSTPDETAEGTQNETHEGTQDTNETENINDENPSNMLTSREKNIQELIGMSDEYKNYLLSILNKAEQEMNATVTSNPEQDDVQIIDEGINAIPANVPHEVHNNPLLNTGNEWQNRMNHTDPSVTNFPNVPYVNQPQRKEWQQNEQEAAQAKTNRYTVFPSDQQQFLPHTYTQQQSIPSTFVPSAQRFSGPSNGQHVYSNTDVPNYPQERCYNPRIPVEKHQTYLSNVTPSCQVQSYQEPENNSMLLIRQQKVPKPVVLSDQQSIEENIPGSRMRYLDKIILNNPDPIFPDSIELRSEYSESAVPNYQPRKHNERAVPSDQQQSYHEGIVPNPLRASRRSRPQRPQHEQLVPGQQQIYSDGVTQNTEHLRYPDPYVTKHQQQIYLKQQTYRGRVPSESPQRYSIPATLTSQRPRYYDPSVLSGQPYRHPIPSAAYVQQQAGLEPTEPSRKQKSQPKRQYQRRKDTSQRQHPAAVRWQQIHSPPIQSHPLQQYAVPPQTFRRVMQPPMVPEVQTVHPIHEQVPEYYEQY